MRNKITQFMALSSTIFLTPVFALAAVRLENPLKVDSFPELMAVVLDIVIAVGMLIATLAIIYSGFLFVTAQGNPEKIETARKALVWTVIGTTILLASWVIAEAIEGTIDAIVA